MLYVIDQRLKAQQIAADKSVQVIHDVTTVLLEPKFIDSLLNGSTHGNAQLITADHCKFMLNDIATCSLMRLDEQSQAKLWNLMTMMYKWQLFMSGHQHHLLDITFRHLDSINKLYPDAKRHMLIDFTKNTLLDFWNACGEEQQLSIYRTNKAWLQCFNTKISLLMRLGFQTLDGSFLREVDQSYFQNFVQGIGENIYIKSNELVQQQEHLSRATNSKSGMDQLAAQLNIRQAPVSGEDLQPIDARQFQQQYEKSLQQCNILLEDLDSSNNGASRQTNAAGCEFVQLQTATPTDTGGIGGRVLNHKLLDLYSKMH
ncbi:protein OSCP1 [Scaptodrosophila lebanonensis]|uniref:Protein OSCP1 n=1 Tax=Drosophila lebanonensis TaxID=7225 RepID=A0A6J2UJ38_DROLE|nr:protein OSCP1 [Scaptodrosophila lebanonensis]